jgi:hypothetical protein
LSINPALSTPILNLLQDVNFSFEGLEIYLLQITISKPMICVTIGLEEDFVSLASRAIFGKKIEIQIF